MRSTPTDMRICSLVPGATEVVAALGLADRLVGISHECDFPAAVRQTPVMIESLVDAERATSHDIDERVKELLAAGSPLYRLHEKAFHQAQPNVVLTQDLCHVCSITPDQLAQAIQALPGQPDVLALSPTTLEDILHDIERIARTVGERARGEALIADLRRRLDAVRTTTHTATVRPRVVCLEWLAPLYVAGHWVPEMVELAGGHNVLGSKDTPSHETMWHDVDAAQPDVVIVMPCGYTIDRTVTELMQAGPAQAQWRRAVERWPNLYIVDAASYFSRPGPRLVDGVELLATILHPDPRRPINPIQAIKFEPSTQATRNLS